MNASAILLYQFGHRRSIEAVARSASAFWIGLFLVLITAIPRNYDQFHISEHTAKWIFGPLLFSTASGFLVWFAAYRLGTRRGIRKAELKRTSVGNDWMSFMGLFWMTAPIAWLYAIPVERMFDSLTAAKVNLALLGIVSAWRVVLLTRALHVACDWGFGRAFVSVLAVASGEAFAVTFFGGAFGKALMAAMGGMRNSPEEEILLTGLMSVMGVSMWPCPIAAIAATILNLRCTAQPLPKREGGTFPTGTAVILTGMAGIWIYASIGPQREVAHNARVDSLIAEGAYEEAVRYMSSLSRDDFAPSRQLPPKAYEHTVYERLPRMIAATDSDTATWVNEHLVDRLDIMISHFHDHGKTEARIEGLQESHVEDALVRQYHDGKAWTSRYSDNDWAEMLAALNQTAPGRRWIRDRSTFLGLLLQALEKAHDKPKSSGGGEPPGWTNAIDVLRYQLGVRTNLAHEILMEDE